MAVGLVRIRSTCAKHDRIVPRSCDRHDVARTACRFFVDNFPPSQYYKIIVKRRHLSSTEAGTTASPDRNAFRTVLRPEYILHLMGEDRHDEPTDRQTLRTMLHREAHPS
jgi:hypothetical protein